MDKNKGMMIVIIIMLGIIIAAIVAGAVFLFTGDFMNQNQPQMQATGVWHTQEISEADIRSFQLSSPITTNLLQSPGGGRGVVRVEVGVGINNIDTEAADEFIQTLMEREIVITHTATEILRRTTREQLEAVGGIEALADDILVALQDAFGSHLIVRVYLGNLFTA